MVALVKSLSYKLVDCTQRSCSMFNIPIINSTCTTIMLLTLCFETLNQPLSKDWVTFLQYFIGNSTITIRSSFLLYALVWSIFEVSFFMRLFTDQKGDRKFAISNIQKVLHQLTSHSRFNLFCMTFLFNI